MFEDSNSFVDPNTFYISDRSACDNFTKPPASSAIFQTIMEHYERIKRNVNSALTPTVLCGPFVKLPPYQCTDLDQQPYFQILSNALAFTTSFIGISFTLSSMFFNFIGGHKVASLNGSVEN